MIFESRNGRPVPTIQNVLTLCNEEGLQFQLTASQWSEHNAPSLTEYVRLIKRDGSIERARSYIIQHVWERCCAAGFYQSGLRKTVEMALKPAMLVNAERVVIREWVKEKCPSCESEQPADELHHGGCNSCGAKYEKSPLFEQAL